MSDDRKSIKISEGFLTPLTLTLVRKKKGGLRLTFSFDDEGHFKNYEHPTKGMYEKI